MADLPIDYTLESKKNVCQRTKKKSFIIHDKSQLDKWFKDVGEDEKTASEGDATGMIYRGMTEAEYKLSTSSQRIWIGNEMAQTKLISNLLATSSRKQTKHLNKKDFWLVRLFKEGNRIPNTKFTSTLRRTYPSNGLDL